MKLLYSLFFAFMLLPCEAQDLYFEEPYQAKTIKDFDLKGAVKEVVYYDDIRYGNMEIWEFDQNGNLLSKKYYLDNNAGLGFELYSSENYKYTDNKLTTINVLRGTLSSGDEGFYVSHTKYEAFINYDSKDRIIRYKTLPNFESGFFDFSDTGSTYEVRYTEKDGRKVKEEYYFMHEEGNIETPVLVQTIMYEYNQNGNLIKKTLIDNFMRTSVSFYENGIKTSEEVILFDQYGNKIAEQTTTNGNTCTPWEIKYQYDTNGNIMQTETRFYDDCNKEVMYESEKITYTSDGIKIKTEYTYHSGEDEKGRVATVYTHNENGRIINSVTKYYNEDNEDNSYPKVDFIYDTYGNLIEKGNDKYEITYYD